MLRSCAHRLTTTLLLAGALLPGVLAAAPPPTLATIGILQGSAVLVRQSSRFALVEGASLVEGDIVETAPGAFAQIEFIDGTLVGVGESGKLLLAPKLTSPKSAIVPRLYLLDGWLKLRLPAKPEGGFALLAPSFELEAKSGAALLRQQPKAYAAFVETGAVMLTPRDAARATVELKAKDFMVHAAGAETPSVSQRMDPAFLQQMPPMFRQPLPARSGQYARKTVELKPIGTIAYGDVAPWLQSEPVIRLALSRQWRGRAGDRAFRAELASHLSAHPEWERVLFPERFLPKKPPAPASAAAPSPAPAVAASAPLAAAPN